jgi:hypothetical protein
MTLNHGLNVESGISYSLTTFAPICPYSFAELGAAAGGAADGADEFWRARQTRTPTMSAKSNTNATTPTIIPMRVPRLSGGDGMAITLVVLVLVLANVAIDGVEEEATMEVDEVDVVVDDVVVVDVVVVVVEDEAAITVDVVVGGC